MCMVDANLEFSNCTFSFGGVFVICSRPVLPNNYSGIPFGQRSVLGRMQYVVKPKAVLLSQGVEAFNDSWGQIDLQGHTEFPATGGKFVQIG